MNFTLRTFFAVLLSFSLSGFSIELRFDSGLPKVVSWESDGVRLSEAEATEKILEAEFGKLKDLNWKVSKRQEDKTHVHLTYDLYFQESPVFFQHLKLHYNKRGFVDYLTSTLQKFIEVPVLPERHAWEERKNEAAALLFGRTLFIGFSTGNLGLWLDEEQEKIEWAFYVKAVPKGPEMVRHGVVSVENPRVLEEKQVVRHWGERNINLQVFTPFPPELSGGKAIPKSVDVGTSGNLENKYVHVQFDRLPGGTASLTEVKGDTTPLTYKLSPADYQTACDGSTECPNQRVDSGNVFYHLGEYRDWLKVQFASFGSEVRLAYDPLRVIVNYMTKAVQKKCEDGTPVTAAQQSNNAAYIGGSCDDDGIIDHCLVFFRYGNDSPCSPGADPGGSFAREALIVIHEYQHYVTDMITGIEFGAANQLRVGDIIHEGYSDYFGAGYALRKAIEENSSPPLTTNQITTISTVGGYAFRVGALNYRRNLQIHRKFDPTTIYDEPHTPGWVWASALWELRDSLGASTVDLIALKSLYYLSTTPGFIDSVEALVQADRSLNGGVNETRIRTLLFDERKFLGSLTGAFQDADKKILKVGFQGCANAQSDSKQAESGFPTLAVFVLWLFTTLWGGKRIWKSQ